MDKWFWHAEVGVCVEGICEIGRRGGYCGGVWRNKLVAADGSCGVEGVCGRSDRGIGVWIQKVVVGCRNLSDNSLWGILGES